MTLGESIDDCYVLALHIANNEAEFDRLLVRPERIRTGRSLGETEPIEADPEPYPDNVRTPTLPLYSSLAHSKPPTGSLCGTLRLPQHGREVLGADLNCSESGRGSPLAVLGRVGARCGFMVRAFWISAVAQAQQTSSTLVYHSTSFPSGGSRGA